MKDGLNKLASLVAAGAGGAGNEEAGETDPEMQAVLDFVKSRGHDILGAQELLIACAMELNLQMQDGEGDDE